MKITEISVVDLQVPSLPPRSQARRRSWIHDAARAFPISKYSEFVSTKQPVPGMDETPLWVRITVENGTWGLGCCGFGSVAQSMIERVYTPLLIGRDCIATEWLNDLMWRAIQRLGDAGHAVIAQSAIDLALWDLKGKLLQQPVYRLLGGPCRNTIPLYATTDDLDWALELGFSAFKISNPVHAESGTAGLNQLEDKVGLAREIVGPDADLMLNPVMAYDVTFAIQVAERLRPYRLRWLEEPLIPNDLRGHQELKRAVPWMPIATGEDHHGRHAFLKLIEARCVDVVQPDLCWCGGLSEALKIYTLAEAAGIPTSPHLAGSSAFGQHLALAMPQVILGEYWLASDPGVALHEVARIPGTATATSGTVTPTDAPGFGLEIKPEWIKPR